MRVGNQPENSPIRNTEAYSSKRTSKSDGVENSRETSENSSANRSEEAVAATISSKAREMVKAKEVASSAPDVREAKIAELKRRIANREYNVKPEAIADKIVKEHLETKEMG